MPRPAAPANQQCSGTKLGRCCRGCLYALPDPTFGLGRRLKLDRRRDRRWIRTAQDVAAPQWGRGCGACGRECGPAAPVHRPCRQFAHRALRRSAHGSPRHVQDLCGATARPPRVADLGGYALEPTRPPMLPALFGRGVLEARGMIFSWQDVRDAPRGARRLVTWRGAPRHDGRRDSRGHGLFGRADPYRGERVAICAGRIVAYGKDPERVAGEAHGSVRSPLTEYFFGDLPEVPFDYTVPPCPFNCCARRRVVR